MKSQTLLYVVIIALVLVGGWWLYSTRAQTPGQTGSNITTPAGIMFSYASSTYALATTPDQLLAKSYIPPCDSNFDYCLYRTGDAYKGTNFESAGLRVKARTDLTTKESCLSTLPDGYTNITPVIKEAEEYTTSTFLPLGGAGAGHYAAGGLYRLYVAASSSCTEFETRIGQTQFANYSAGSIKEFTTTDYANVYSELGDILKSVTIAATGKRVDFFSPSPSSATIGFGESITMAGATIKALDVVEDSRCPVDVQCIQAGTVRIRASVNKYDLDFTFVLGKPQTIDGATITLTAVAPEKNSKVTIKPSDYRFTFTATK